MTRFTVTTESSEKLKLRSVCEKHVNELWIPDHLDKKQAEAFALDHFRRVVLAELEMLKVCSE